jgi:hypothetical protein
VSRCRLGLPCQGPARAAIAALRAAGFRLRDVAFAGVAAPTASHWATGRTTVPEARAARILAAARCELGSDFLQACGALPGLANA